MAIAQMFVGSFVPPVAVTGITVTPITIALDAGKTAEFTVAIAPDNATNKRYTVTSANPDLVSVVRVDGDKWRATAAETPDAGGPVVITIASVANPSITATLTVTVRIPVTSITVDKPTITGDAKTTQDVVFTILPANATNTSVTLSSSATAVATVAQKSVTDNKITATINLLTSGSANITAKSVSDPTVSATVAVTSVQVGPSDAEKIKYYTDNLAKAKAGTYTGRAITANLSPLEGWTPFADTGKGTPAEMIAAIARAGTADLNAIIPGDYFDVTAGGTTYRYVCNGRDQYYIAGNTTNGKHHFTFVPDKIFPTAMAYDTNGSNEWTSSTLKTWMEGTFFNSLPAAVRSSIITLNVPFTTYSGTRSSVSSKVFPPSEIEAFGAKQNSAETAGGTPPNNAYVVLSRTNDTRKRTGANKWYWLRSSYSGRTDGVPVVWADGTAVSYNAGNGIGGALPCFNIG